MSFAGKTCSPEHKAKLSKLRKGKPRPGWVPKGNDHHKFQLEPSYMAIHKWLATHFPKSGICEHCGGASKKMANDYALIHGREYSREREDYLELCRSCHRKYDKSPTLRKGGR